jgi:hypothetical protein
MKKYLPGSLFLILLALIALYRWSAPVQTDEVNLLNPLPSNEENEEELAIYVKERWKREWEMLKDPWTGTIPENIRQEELKLARSIPVRGELSSSGLYGPILPQVRQMWGAEQEPLRLTKGTMGQQTA